MENTWDALFFSHVSENIHSTGRASSPGTGGDAFEFIPRDAQCGTSEPETLICDHTDEFAPYFDE